MKKLKFLILSSIIMMLSCCNTKPIKVKVEAQIVTFEKPGLLGEWVQTNKIEDLEKTVRKIIINKNMTCEIELFDGNKRKIINGNWEIGKPYEITAKNINISIKSDIIITYNSDSSHQQKLVMFVDISGPKTMLTAHNLKFEKI